MNAESTQVEVPTANSRSVQPVTPILPVKMVVVATQTTTHFSDPCHRESYKMLSKMQSSPTPLPTKELKVDSELTVSILNTDNDCYKNPVERSATADSKTEPVNITSGDLDCTRYAVLKNPFNPDETLNREVVMISSEPLKERPKASYKECKILAS